MNQAVDQLKVCDDLALIAKKISSAEENKIPSHYKKAAVSLLFLKNRNRAIYLALESKRKEVEAKKDTVDKLKLELENLIYKQAYLRREINICRDLSTPHLAAVENDTRQTLGISEFPGAVELFAKHSEAVNVLRIEKEERIAMQKDYSEMLQKQQQCIDNLERKRKFLDELPTRVALVKAATTDLHGQFAPVLSDSSINNANS